MSDTTTTPPADEKPGKKPVNVKALIHLVEDGNRYTPGDEFQVTPERAKALGEAVTKA
jgi:hypothetical protein